MEKSTPISILPDDSVINSDRGLSPRVISRQSLLPSEPVLARADASLRAKIQQELKFPDPTPEKAKAILASYGACPICGACCETRERKMNGNDTCMNGHSYPSKDAKHA